MRKTTSIRMAAGALLALCMSAIAAAHTSAPQRRSAAPAVPTFHVEEATIDGLHRAIVSGETTCTAVIQAYLARARAYDGACTRLVTSDGAPIAPGPGAVRAGAPVAFSSTTTAVSTVLPQFDQYTG